MNETTKPEPEVFSAPPRLVAVIDIGASSLRMQIAEINVRTQEVRRLESFSQAVSIGNDSFGGRRIQRQIHRVREFGVNQQLLRESVDALSSPNRITSAWNAGTYGSFLHGSAQTSAEQPARRAGLGLQCS